MQSIHLTDLPSVLTSSTVLIYPTDTIYGLGGLVTPEVGKKIKQIKQRSEEKHFSIVAPSFAWIASYFAVAEHFSEQRNQYKTQFPGRGLTLLLPLQAQRPNDIDFSILTTNGLVGVRFLDHPFQNILEKIGKPFITTSANLSGQLNITHPDQLLDEQTQLIDYCIDEGTLDRSTSVIIDYGTQEIIRR